MCNDYLEENAMITFLYDQLIYIQFSVLFRLSATQTIHGLAIATHS